MVAREYLDARAERLVAKGLLGRTRTALGVPAAGIVATAEAEKADLINAEGQLEVEDVTGRIRRVLSGEIRLME